MKVTRRQVLGSCVALGAIGVTGGAFYRDRGSSLRFDETVGPALRERCRQAERRTAELVDRWLDVPVRVTLVDEHRTDAIQPSDRFETAVFDATHVTDVEWPSGYPGPRGAYSPTDRTISFVDPEAFDASRVLGTPSGADGGSDGYPTEPHIAHELAHAVQRDAVGRVSQAEQTRDSLEASRTVVEGTAEYVAGRYRSECLDDGRDTCARTEFQRRSVLQRPFLLAAGGSRYVNGRLFAHAVRQSGGWSAIWEAHRRAPATTLEVTYPDRYASGEVEPTAVASGPEPSPDWLRIDDDRLGIQPLYTKLFVLGAAALDEVSSAVTDAIAARYAYRTPVLEEWAGDRFTAYGYVDDLDRVGSRWRTAWGSAEAAVELLEAVEDGYNAVGTYHGDHWELSDTVVWTRREGTVVTFGVAPDRAAMDALRPDDSTA